MIKTISILKQELKEYKNIGSKIKRLVNDEKLFPIVKGLYETDNKISGYYLSSYIYGPSYLSFEFALSYHGLIPEAVYTFTCATFEKKKKKTYNTSFGTFTYRDVPSKAYPYEIKLILDSGYSLQIATAEKSVCDMLYVCKPVYNISNLKYLIFEDLRIDTSEFSRLNFSTLNSLCDMYNTTNHKLLKSLIRKEYSNG